MIIITPTTATHSCSSVLKQKREGEQHERRETQRREKERKVSSITAPHPVSAHQVDLVTRGDTAPTNCAAPFDIRHPMSQKGDSAGQLAALRALVKQALATH